MGRRDLFYYSPALKTYRWPGKLTLSLAHLKAKNWKDLLGQEDFKKGFSETQANRGFDKVLDHGKRIADAYAKVLLRLGIEPPYEPEYGKHTYLRFPLLVKDGATFLRSADFILYSFWLKWEIRCI